MLPDTHKEETTSYGVICKNTISKKNQKNIYKVKCGLTIIIKKQNKWNTFIISLQKYVAVQAWMMVYKTFLSIKQSPL